MDSARELAALLATAYPGNVSVTMLQAVLLAEAGKVSGVRCGAGGRKWAKVAGAPAVTLTLPQTHAHARPTHRTGG
jgi:hypothetical protein